MKRFLFTIVALLVLGEAQTGQAQNRPDFSGSWKLDETKSIAPVLPPRAASETQAGAPPPPPTPRVVAITISQTATELRLDRTMSQGGQSGVFKLLYLLDARESTNQIGPIVSKSTTVWDGSKLIVSSRHFANGNPIGDSTEIYSLTEGNLTIEETRNSRIVRLTSKSVYARGRQD